MSSKRGKKGKSRKKRGESQEFELRDPESQIKDNFKMILSHRGYIKLPYIEKIKFLKEGKKSINDIVRLNDPRAESENWTEKKFDEWWEKAGCDAEIEELERLIDEEEAEKNRKRKKREKKKRQKSRKKERKKAEEGETKVASETAGHSFGLPDGSDGTLLHGTPWELMKARFPPPSSRRGETKKGGKRKTRLRKRTRKKRRKSRKKRCKSIRKKRRRKTRRKKRKSKTIRRK